MSDVQVNGSGVRGKRERSNRFRLALWIVGFVFAAITALAMTVIIAADQGDRPQVAQDIFVVLLPVFAAWVGAVIAFYFGQENFESASVQAQALVDSGGQEPQIPVTEIMQPIHEMVTYKMSGGPEDTTLQELNSKAYFGRVNRLLIVDDADHPVYLIHRSRVIDFLQRGGDPGGSLADFLEAEKSQSPSLEYGAGSGFVVLASDASRSAAKVAMDAAAGVSDIVITRTGGANEPAWGWITDVQLRERLSA